MKNLFDLFMLIRQGGTSKNISLLLKEKGAWFDTDIHPVFGRTVILTDGQNKVRINMSHVQGGK